MMHKIQQAGEVKSSKPFAVGHRPHLTYKKFPLSLKVKAKVKGDPMALTEKMKSLLAPLLMVPQTKKLLFQQVTKKRQLHSKVQN